MVAFGKQGLSVESQEEFVRHKDPHRTAEAEYERCEPESAPSVEGATAGLSAEQGSRDRRCCQYRGGAGAQSRERTLLRGQRANGEIELGGWAVSCAGSPARQASMRTLCASRWGAFWGLFFGARPRGLWLG